MELKFMVQTRINKPIDQVFEAVINEKKLSGYFTTRSSAPLSEGQTVIWNFSNFGDLRVGVKKIIPRCKIVLEWKAGDGEYNTVTVMDFEELPGQKTLLKISELGWKPTQAGLEASYENCSGWQHMGSCLKAYLEHGIDLRV